MHVHESFVTVDTCSYVNVCVSKDTCVIINYCKRSCQKETYVALNFTVLLK